MGSVVELGALHLRLHPADDADLRWFWGDAGGELGLRGQSYEPRVTGPMIAPDSISGDPLVDRRARAAERYDRIAGTLSRMPRRLQRVLQRWCGPHVEASSTVRAEFGDFAGIVGWTKSATGRDVEAICRDKEATAHAPPGASDAERQDAAARTKTIRAHARALVLVLRAESQALLSEAAFAYGQAKPRRRKAS